MRRRLHRASWQRSSLPRGERALRPEADFLVRAVAERLVGRRAAAAEPGLGLARDRASARAADFKRAFDHQRSIFQGRHFQGTIATLERLRFCRRRLAGCLEARFDMAVIAIGLHLRMTAAAERRAEARFLAIDVELRVESERSVLPDAHRVHARRLLLRPAVDALVEKRA